MPAFDLNSQFDLAGRVVSTALRRSCPSRTRPAYSEWRCRSAAWLWSLLLLVVAVVIHTFGLRMIDRRVTFVLDDSEKNRLLRMVSWLIMPVVTLCTAILHGTEGMIWAAAYVLLGALPDRKNAMLYSMNAMTSFGHVDLRLAPHWQLMGSLEALNGWILFGLTTAFLFTTMQRVWPHLNSSHMIPVRSEVRESNS